MRFVTRRRLLNFPIPESAAQSVRSDMGGHGRRPWPWRTGGDAFPHDRAISPALRVAAPRRLRQRSRSCHRATDRGSTPWYDLPRKPRRAHRHDGCLRYGLGLRQRTSLREDAIWSNASLQKVPQGRLLDRRSQVRSREDRSNERSAGRSSSRLPATRQRRSGLPA